MHELSLVYISTWPAYQKPMTSCFFIDSGVIRLSLWDNEELEYNYWVDFNWWITVAVFQKSLPLAGIGRYWKV